MTMWTKLKKSCGGVGAKPSTTPTMSHRTVKGVHFAELLLPKAMVSGTRCDIMTDGNGKLAFVMSDNGEYAVGKSGARGRISVPRAYAERIPLGSSPVELTNVEGMLVLDLTQFASA